MSAQDEVLGTLMGPVRGFYEAMQRFDMAAAEALGISVRDLRCINILRDGPLTPTEIAHRVRLTSGATTGLIDRLERIGAVERRAVEDRRSVAVELKPDFRERAREIYSQLGGAIRAELKQAGLDMDPVAMATVRAIVAGTIRGGEAVEQAVQSGQRQPEEE